MRNIVAVLGGLVLLGSLAPLAAVAPAAADKSPPPDLEAQVDAVERAFAKTMADGDFEAFRSFLSDEAVFLAGALERRGKKAVAEHWQRYFEAEEPPFSWEPATVVVLESGRLALSTGPVRDPGGVVVSYYTSIWRQEEPGVWRIVFDKGNKACD